MTPKGNSLAPHLKTVRKKNGTRFFYYIMPDGSLESLGKDQNAAIEAANALNVALRSSGSLVERVLDIAKQPKRKKYDPTNPPMSQVIQEFKDEVLADDLARKKIGKDSYNNKLSILELYGQSLNKVTCQEVTTFDLATILKTKTGNTQQKHMPVLKKLFRFAISSGYRVSNPANELSPKEPEKRKRKRHTWDGYQAIWQSSPEWLRNAINVALYSLQRRSDLVSIHSRQINRAEKSIEIFQQKTRNYANPVYIKIMAGDALWSAISTSLNSGVLCPYLIHYRPQRISKKTRDAKAHPFAVLPDYLSKEFTRYRDLSGAYDYLPREERPTLHDLRALGILMYHKAGYSKDYIMALAGHANEATTDHYIDGHENIKPVAVQAGLSVNQVQVSDIDWKTAALPPELARLVDDE